MTTRNVLMVGISTTGDVGMSFATCVLALQSELLRRPNLRASFDIVESLNDAMVKFANEPQYDTLVAVDTSCSVEPGFFFDRDDDKDFVVGVYPEGIDWDRIAERMLDSSEDPHLVGMRYNVTPEKGAVVTGTKYLAVPTAGLKIVRMTRKVIDELKANHPNIGDAYHAMSVIDGKTLRADERLCALWGRPIHADLRHKTGCHSRVVYGPGCIAWRSTIR